MKVRGWLSELVALGGAPDQAYFPRLVKLVSPRRTATVLEGERQVVGSVRLILTLAVLGGLLLLWAALGGEYAQTLAGLFAAYVVSAIGFNLVVGFSGQMAFGHAGFMAIGAYTYAVLAQYDVPSVVSAILAMLLSGVAAALVGAGVVRTRHIYLALVTLAFAEGVVQIIQVLGVTNGDQGIGVDVLGSNFFIASAGAAVLAVLLVDRLLRSRFGRSMLMVRSDEEAAAAMGVQVFKVKVVAFTLSGVFGGAGGLLLAADFSYITPENFTTTLTLEMLLMVVVGGLGTLWGPVLGAAFLVWLNQVLESTLDLQPIIYGVALCVALMLLPGGIVSLSSRARALARRPRLNRLKRSSRGRSPL